MSDDSASDDGGQSVAGWLPDLLQGGLPQLALGKHLSNALGRLISGITDVPAAALRNVAERIRGDTDARRKVRTALATAAAKAAKEHSGLVEGAVRQWAPASIRKQANREAVAAKVLENLADDPPPADVIEGPTDDFMNLFEDAAERASSDNLRDLLGRILAGELRTPRSFSLQTLQFASVVDRPLAQAMTQASGWITQDFIPIVGNLRFDDNLAILDELAENGLLRSGVFTRQVARQDGKIILSFPYHDILITEGLAPTIVIPAAPLSRKGKEVMQLVPPADDEGTIAEIATGLAREAGSVGKFEIRRRALPEGAKSPSRRRRASPVPSSRRTRKKPADDRSTD